MYNFFFWKHYLFVAVFVTLFCAGQSQYYDRVDCCLPKYSKGGMNCIHPAHLANQTFKCIDTLYTCDNCRLNDNITQHMAESICFQCCIPLEEINCYEKYNKMPSSTWTLMLLIFLSSCCCCTAVFLSAEKSRIREGLSINEAYLLPIPTVTPNTNFDENDYKNVSSDLPEAVAKSHTSLDVPVAEPADTVPLMGNYRFR